MSLILISFAISCMTQFAQYYQLLLDQEESNQLRSKLSPIVIQSITSPTTGRLNLPPPSTKKRKTSHK